MKTPPATPVDPTLQASSRSNKVTQSSRKQSSGATQGATAPHDAPSSSYLSRKAHAHRFSSLKRQKKPSGLIQHLFGGASREEDDEEDTENLRDPAPADSLDEQEGASGCMTYALSEAMSSLRLDHEADVRRTIQRSMEEAQESMLDAKSMVMEVVCSTLEQQQGADTPADVNEGSTEAGGRPRSPSLPPLEHPKYALDLPSNHSQINGSAIMSPMRSDRDKDEAAREWFTPQQLNHSPAVYAKSSSDDKRDDRSLELNKSVSWQNSEPSPRVSPEPPTENQVERHVESIADALKRVFLASTSNSPKENALHESPNQMQHLSPRQSSAFPADVLVEQSVSTISQSVIPLVPPSHSMPALPLPSTMPIIQTVVTSPSTFLAPMDGVTKEAPRVDDDETKVSPDITKSVDCEPQTHIDDRAVVGPRATWEAEQEHPLQSQMDSLPDDHENIVMDLQKQIKELKQEKQAMEAELSATIQRRLEDEVAKSKTQWQQEVSENQAKSLQQRIIKEVELAKQQWDRESAVRQRSLQEELEIAKKQWELEMLDQPAGWVQDLIQAEIDASKTRWETDYATKQQEMIYQQLDAARNQWEMESVLKQEERIRSELDLAISKSMSHEVAAKEELESEIHRLQRKINEQKDQTLMAKQLAKQHQVEMEQMEAKLAELSQKTDQVSKLQQQVVDLQRERDEKLASMAQEVKEAKKQNEVELAVLQAKLAEKTKELEQASQSKVQLEKDREQQVAHIRKMQGVLGRALSPSKAALSPASRGGESSPAFRGTPSPIGSPRSNSVSSPTAEAKLAQSREELAKLKVAMEELRSSKKAIEEALKSEVEALRLQMTEAKVTDSVEIESLKLRLESLVESKRQELEISEQKWQSVQAELEQLKRNSCAVPDQQEFLEKLESLEREKRCEIESLTSQLLEVRGQLAAKERELSFTLQSSARVATPEPLTKAKRELTSLRREIDQLRKSKDGEISELQGRIKSLTERHHEKRFGDGSPAKRVGTPGRTTPSRIPFRSGRRDSGGPEVLERDLHEREKEVLRQHVVVLEDQVRRMSSEHEKALEDLRKQGESELTRIKKEMENRIEKHLEAERELKETLATVDSVDKEELLERIERLESEKRADRSGGLREVQKKEELLQRITVLEKREKELMKEQEVAMQEIRDQSDLEIRRLQNEIERQRQDSLEKAQALERAITETESFEKEDLLQRIDKLESQLENERNGAVLVKMKVASLEKEAKQAEKSYRDELEALKTALEAERKTLEAAKRESSELEETLKSMTDERNALHEQTRSLAVQSENMGKQHLAELEKLRSRHSEELDRHRRHAAEQIVKVERDAKGKIAPLQRELEQLRKDKECAENSRGLLPEDEEALRNDLADAKAQVELQTKAFEDRLCSLQQEFDAKLSRLNEKHEQERGEMTRKLAETESDYRVKFSDLQKSTSEKDAIITALGSQLADVHGRSKKGDEHVRGLTEKLEQSRKELTQAYGEIGKLKNELQTLVEKHDAFVKVAENAKEVACEEARDEMIERAEIQFKQANELYVKLKKQYDVCKKKVTALDSELSKTKQALREHEISQSEFKAQIDSLKAENSKIEEEAARKGKEYRKEMERLLQAAEDFEKKFKAAEQTSRHAYKKLATANAEKENLQKECDEIKSVCEELMAMVEGRNIQHEC
jgi:chromosome segregation ATPase